MPCCARRPKRAARSATRATGNGGEPPIVIDVHCHYSFSARPATAGPRFRFEPSNGGTANPTAGTAPTVFDACLAPRVLNRLPWRLARWWQRLPPPGPPLDAQLADEYARHLGSGGLIDRYVLLAFDAVHDDAGQMLPLAGPGARVGTDMYTANSLVYAVCRAHPQRFLFGASIHPYRPDALACVEEVFAAGACLLKWIPLYHNIAVADARTVAVLRRCGELGLPLLMHFGEEFTLTSQYPQHGALQPLLRVLAQLQSEGRMPTVIVAHAATPVTPWGSRASWRALLEALTGAFAAAPLYADVSALAAPGKAGFLKALRRRPELHHKLLFGSDFPVPPVFFRLRGALGRHYARLAEIPSWPERSAALLRWLGFHEIIFHRAARILPHVS